MQRLVLNIQTREYLYSPQIAGEILLERPRRGAPGKLSFGVLNDDVISFHEGDHVLLSQGEETLFSGFVFSKRRQFGKTITVTAYDQLRYLKNRDIYVYGGLTAAQLVRQMAGDWGIRCGEIQNTGYAIPERIENGRPLLDIIQTALDLTEEQTGERFVLYDEAGELQLRHVWDMALDTLIHEGSIVNFDYTSSIDRDSYSAVRLYRPDRSYGETLFFEDRREDLIERWGNLRHFERLAEGLEGQETARRILERRGQKSRRLSIVKAAGDTRVRGGSMLPVDLHLGDIVVGEFLMVERVLHRFSEGGHIMDMSLVGGEFVD